MKKIIAFTFLIIVSGNLTLHCSDKQRKTLTINHCAPMPGKLINALIVNGISLWALSEIMADMGDRYGM